MNPTREELLEKAAAVASPPVAVEACWDGDTTGWYVVLVLICAEPSAGPPAYREYHLGALRGPGGDLRLFNGGVPPWPEAARAREVGQELAGRLGVPFYFASPDRPEDDCPRWWDRDKAYPCRRCGLPLLQGAGCPWRGACYECHLAERREAAAGGGGPGRGGGG